jgi:hypothetical protein
MDWMYNGTIFDKPDATDVGFVYLITCIPTGRKYIGKKLFWSTKTKQIKGKKKKIKVESDWKKYWSSSAELKADVAKLGENNFRRTILYLCKSKGEANYLEAREQFAQGVLEYPSLWYNGWIIVKVSGSHIKRLHIEL